MPNTRPLSPHLGVYRWRVNMQQSVLHRLTGLSLCLGTLVFAWGLIAAAIGETAWHQFAGITVSWFGLLLMIMWTWSLFFHLCNGIQHLLRDIGLNFGPPTRDRAHKPVYWTTGWIVVGLSVGLTVLVWLALLVRVGGAA